MYAPASTRTNSGTLGHLATVWYNRRALSTLRKHTHFWKTGRMDDLPLQNGKLAQWFRPTEFGSNTTASTEGEVGTGLVVSSSTITATVSQFTDYISLSDFLVETDIVNSIQMATDRLSYRGALTTDTLIRNELDSAATDQPLLGDVLSAVDLARSRFEYAGLDVEGMENGYFKVLSHPYVLYDLMNDPQAGGFQDLSKYIDSLKNSNITVPDRGLIARIHNCEVWETSNAYQVSGSPNKWRTYVVGYEAVGILRLAGKGPSFITDPDKERFKVRVIRNNGDQIADPEVKIAAAVSYNFKFVTKTLDANRLRKIDAPSSIVA